MSISMDVRRKVDGKSADVVVEVRGSIKLPLSKFGEIPKYKCPFCVFFPID